MLKYYLVRIEKLEKAIPKKTTKEEFIKEWFTIDGLSKSFYLAIAQDDEVAELMGYTKEEVLELRRWIAEAEREVCHG